MVHAACKCNKIPFNLRSACQDKDNNVFLLVLNYRRNSRNFFCPPPPQNALHHNRGEKDLSDDQANKYLIISKPCGPQSTVITGEEGGVGGVFIPYNLIAVLTAPGELPQHLLIAGQKKNLFFLNAGLYHTLVCA